MINNHYLFSSQFRSYLHAQELDDPAFFEGFVATVSSFLQAAATAELDALTQRVIAPILSQLQFANPPLETVPTAPAARYAYLYDGFPLTKQVSCVYVVPNSPPESRAVKFSSDMSSRLRSTSDIPLIERSRDEEHVQNFTALPPGRGQGWVLDVAEKGNFPAFDLIQLLQQANLEWGMLTNGMVWRLYSTRAPQPYEQYLEIDFSDAQPEDFKIFWQLFSLALFLTDEQEVTPLETYIAESQQEATVIEKHIKGNIEALLENICVGLLAYAGKDKQPLTEAEQQSYFENAVYLLFRLLFVLYAESRELLPAHDPAYQTISLQTLIWQAHAWKQAGLVNAAGVELWDGFRDLCDKIQFGDPQLNIPEYDGGLFDSREHPFLADPHNKVSNLYFVNVLDLLGYRAVRKETQPINYRDLSVRSLGSLYEGILEYKLFLATEELVLRGQTLIPRKDAGKVKKTERVIAPGQVYFAQAANERHDTGSYYTPEEVVNYMVQHSVRVGLEERWSAFQPTAARYEQEVRQAVSEDVRRALRRKFDQEVLNFVETQVLSFKVLDPAMGSGHFLVNALHAITHFILEVLQRGGDAAATSLLAHHNPAIDLTPALWRRKVVERCIFGVDLNPLAAELAKLSLWIASASAGKPLTFLNHHLKCGDSLLGIRLKDMLTYPGISQSDQFTIWDMIDKEKIGFIKNRFYQFLSHGSDEIHELLSKKEEYEEIANDPVLKNLKDIATLWSMISININNKKGLDLFDTPAIPYPEQNQYFKLIRTYAKLMNLLDTSKHISIA
ncbi:putative restriction/modification enzyme [Candidatus Vecturithrix granuli]|uniref:site-specific DNA-methyltransferase (adenine-specific) n=1 Tax=Vecturithrix granuli TaxID=1499967 RepID=A0A081C870_VECG1|nr:putative restriction/modification enzyme [Candidatus Vecturithrix granuli]